MLSDKTLLEIDYTFVKKRKNYCSHTEVIWERKKSMGNLVQTDLGEKKKKEEKESLKH